MKKGRASRLAELAELPVTFIIYESPLRLARTLSNLAEVCGDDREASVSREISKIYDTTHRGTLSELTQYFSVNQARGEIVIIIAGKPREDAKNRRHRNKFRSEDETETLN